jgi:hypothetical protein
MGGDSEMVAQTTIPTMRPGCHRVSITTSGGPPSTCRLRAGMGMPSKRIHPFCQDGPTYSTLLTSIPPNRSRFVTGGAA